MPVETSPSAPGSPPAAFEQIAAVYDRTRGPLDPETAENLAAELRARGLAHLLEVGVGTGRVSLALTARGLDMTGVDAARAMLRAASEKRLRRLLQGTAYRLPFRDATFDAVLMAHVLHLLEDPRAALREAHRVAPGATLSLVGYPDREEAPERFRGEDGLRAELHELLRAEGIEVPPFSPPWKAERHLLRTLPPTETVPLSDRWEETPAETRIETFALRGFRNLLDVPPGALARATATLRERHTGETVRTRRFYALAIWRDAPPDTLRSVPPTR